MTCRLWRDWCSLFLTMFFHRVCRLCLDGAAEHTVNALRSVTCTCKQEAWALRLAEHVDKTLPRLVSCILGFWVPSLVRKLAIPGREGSDSPGPPSLGTLDWWLPSSSNTDCQFVLFFFLSLSPFFWLHCRVCGILVPIRDGTHTLCTGKTES